MTEAYGIELLLDSDHTVDPQELDSQTRFLKRELERLGAAVEFTPGSPAPAGTRTVEVAPLGALAIAVIPTVFPKLLEFLKVWLPNHENRKIRIKIQSGTDIVEAEFPSDTTRDSLRGLVKDFSRAIEPPTRHPPIIGTDSD